MKKSIIKKLKKINKKSFFYEIEINNKTLRRFFYNIDRIRSIKYSSFKVHYINTKGNDRFIIYMSVKKNDAIIFEKQIDYLKKIFIVFYCRIDYNRALNKLIDVLTLKDLTPSNIYKININKVNFIISINNVYFLNFRNEIFIYMLNEKTLIPLNKGINFDIFSNSTVLNHDIYSLYIFLEENDFISNYYLE